MRAEDVIRLQLAERALGCLHASGGCGQTIGVGERAIQTGNGVFHDICFFEKRNRELVWQRGT